MRSNRHRLVALATVLGIASTLLVGSGGSAAGLEPAPAPIVPAGGCALADHPGGEWAMYGRDLGNTRHQVSESQISPTNVATLAADWKFSAVDQGGTGRFESTPVIAEGCVYITTSSGFLYALNADSGEMVWQERLAERVSGVCCGGTLFAPSVNDGVVYVNVSQNPETSSDERGPFVVALDAHTGERLWTSAPVAFEGGSYTNTSAVYFDGLLWIGISNPEQAFQTIGGFAILDASDGTILKRTRTVPADQFEAGMGGGAIWSTAAVDTDTKTGYVGTGQPSPWNGPESEYVNAIIKFDLDRSSQTFGEIVGAVKGTWDEPPYIDVDFGASPTLYKDEYGRKMVAALQKSGVVHAGYTRHMTHSWSTPISFGTALSNYSSTATDGTNIYAVGTYPGQMFSLNGTTGRPNWVSPVGTIFGANPVAYANGVVYHADGKGFLDAYDAATGAPLMHRPMSADAGSLCSNIGGGVSIARNTVFAVCGDRNVSASIGPTDAPTGYLIAYRLPE